MADETPVIRNYESAPVIETVLSIQFRPITKFSVPHFGLYWKVIREKYPRSELRPPILHLIEEFGSAQTKTTLPPSWVELPSESLIRCWFMEEKQNFFLQVQQDRFLFNWQKLNLTDQYPRYSQIRPRFMQEWERFCSFLESENLGTPQVDQCEVTYVNHIDYPSDQEAYSELKNIVSYWSGLSSGTFLPQPDKVNIQVRYAIPDNSGRLYIALQPVIRTRDAKEVLQLNVTARGAPSSSKSEDIFEWLDLGRKWVVEGFTDFTTKQMHKLWGRDR